MVEHSEDLEDVIVQALSEPEFADGLRALHHRHLWLDANARHFIAKQVVKALGLERVQRPTDELSTLGRLHRCGSFGCTLPKGHNMGRADIPANHNLDSTLACVECRYEAMKARCKKAVAFWRGEVERLRAENERLREALEACAACIEETGTWGLDALAKTRAALAEPTAEEPTP